MKLERIVYRPSTALEFYEAGLTALGSLCDRTWHDRLEVVAEGRAARLWDAEGKLHAGELHFLAADALGVRDPAKEIFPGCPLTFRLADALRQPNLVLHRLLLESDPPPRPPDPTVAERTWHGQFPGTTRWRLAGSYKSTFHFSLLVLARCDIQAIEQQWTIHRIAFSLMDGSRDETLANEVATLRVADVEPAEMAWPVCDPTKMLSQIRVNLEQVLAGELDLIRARQSESLRRDLERVDAYFENYQQELQNRNQNQLKETTRLRMSDRLQAARAEHERRRADQVARHEIRVVPHLDSLVILAESAFQTDVQIVRDHRSETLSPVFIPRARRWVL